MNVVPKRIEDVLREIDQNPFNRISSFVGDLRDVAAKLEKIEELEEKHGSNSCMVENTKSTLHSLKHICDCLILEFDRYG